MFENAKIGDKVWEIELGWGEIVNIIKSSTYPLMVKFNINGSIMTFDLSGKYTKIAINPTLFWDEINVEIPKKPKPEFWKPENGEEAYYISIKGEVVESTYWYMDTEDKDVVEQGNVFQTEEEANKEIELRKAKYRVKKRIWELNGGEFIEFNSNEYNWSFDLCSDKIIPEFWSKIKSYPSWQYLKTKKLVKQLINEMHNDLFLIRSE